MLVIKILSSLSSVLFPVFIVSILLVMILGWTIPKPPYVDTWGQVVPDRMEYSDCVNYPAEKGYYIRENTDPGTSNLPNATKINIEDGVSRFNEQLIEYTNLGTIKARYKEKIGNTEHELSEDIPLLSNKFTPVFNNSLNPDSNVIQPVDPNSIPESNEDATVFTPRDIEIQAKVLKEDGGIPESKLVVDIYAEFKKPEPLKDETKKTENEDEDASEKKGQEAIEDSPEIITEARVPELLTTLSGDAGAVWSGIVQYGAEQNVFEDENFIGIYASARYESPAESQVKSTINAKMLTRFGLSDEESPAYIEPEAYSNQPADYVFEHTYSNYAFDNPIAKNRIWTVSPKYNPNFLETQPVDPNVPSDPAIVNAPEIVPRNLHVNVDVLGLQQGTGNHNSPSRVTPLNNLAINIQVVKQVANSNNNENESVLKVENTMLTKVSMTEQEVPQLKEIRIYNFSLTNFYASGNVYSFDLPYFLFKDDVKAGRLRGFVVKVGLASATFPQESRSIRVHSIFGLSDGPGTTEVLPTSEYASKRFPYEIAIDSQTEHIVDHFQGTYNTQRSPVNDAHDYNKFLPAGSKWSQSAKYTPDYSSPGLKGITNRDVKVYVRNYASNTAQNVELRFFDGNDKRVEPPGFKFSAKIEGHKNDKGDDVSWVVPKLSYMDKYGIKSIAVSAHATSWIRDTHIKFYFGLADWESNTEIITERNHVVEWPDNVSLDYTQVKPLGDSAYEYRTFASTEEIARNTYPAGHVFQAPVGNYIDTEVGQENLESDDAGQDDPNVELEPDSNGVKDPSNKDSIEGMESVIYNVCPAKYGGSDDVMPANLSTWLSWAEDEENWNDRTDKDKLGIDVDGAYGAQCADLSKSWLQTALKLDTPPLLTAVDMFMGNAVSGGPSFPPAGVEQRDMNQSGARIMPGDIVFFTFGHTAVVVGGQDESSIFEVLEQNPGSPARKDYTTTSVLSVWKVSNFDQERQEE